MTGDQRPGWVPEKLYPFTSRYIEVEGNHVHYIDEGTGPALLFLHGNPTWSFLYRDIIAALRDSFRCVAPDYPGFGLSSASEGYPFTASSHAHVIERFVTELDLSSVTLMGQDWGGPIGLGVATRHPDRFSGFVLGNTWAWPLNGIFHFEAAARVMGSHLARLWIENTNGFVNVMIPLGTAKKLPDEVMAAYRGPFNDRAARLPTWRFPRELLGSKAYMEQLATDLPTIGHLPVLFTWGGGDFALRKDVELPRLQRLFTNHQTLVIDDARHFFQEDAPEIVSTEIRRWMNQRVQAEEQVAR